jgi:tetratricopeptide (TPR) repeat protein
VSEESERVISGPEGNGAGIDPTAVALALAGASREKADAFLDNQNILIAEQRHHLREQFKQLREQFETLRLGLWEKRLGVLLRIATAFVGLAIAAGVALMVWDAAHSSGLVVEPFSVPPDLAGRGLTGEVVAAKLLDRLAAMQEETTSNRALKSYANSWDEKEFKLDIPETGVSLTEVDGFLRRKLGHDTHISGEVVQTASGLIMTARAGAGGAESAGGSEAELDALIQKSAESVYRLTQPYRFGFYLVTHGRREEGAKILTALATSGPAQERTWGYYGWGGVTLELVGIDEGLRLLNRSLALQPDHILAHLSTAQTLQDEGRPEQAIREERKILSLLDGESRSMIRAEAIPYLKAEARAEIDQQFGAFLDAAHEQVQAVEAGVAGRQGSPAILAQDLVGAHDPTAARAALATPGGSNGFYVGTVTVYGIWAEMLIAVAERRWTDVLSRVQAIDPLLPKYPGLRTLTPTTTEPLIAYAEARLGNFAAAEAHIAATPADCYECIIARARIAELQGQTSRADWWFARAVRDAPSIPFAYSNWGDALLARGKPGAAIDKFKLSNMKGPHFADPLEGWGEALMAKNQSHLALAKFAEAEKYAPNWGRLHLKWGEALIYAGKKDEATAQFTRAAQLDLTPAEKSELVKATSHAKGAQSDPIARPSGH